jgi:hypothetical protein
MARTGRVMELNANSRGTRAVGASLDGRFPSRGGGQSPP